MGQVTTCLSRAPPRVPELLLGSLLPQHAVGQEVEVARAITLRLAACSCVQQSHYGVTVRVDNAAHQGLLTEMEYVQTEVKPLGDVGVKAFLGNMLGVLKEPDLLANFLGHPLLVSTPFLKWPQDYCTV